MGCLCEYDLGNKLLPVDKEMAWPKHVAVNWAMHRFELNAFCNEVCQTGHVDFPWLVHWDGIDEDVTRRVTDCSVCARWRSTENGHACYKHLAGGIVIYKLGF